MKKILLFLFAFIFLIGLSGLVDGTDIIFQENANESAAIPILHDGYYYSNYTKPSNFLNATWYIAHGLNTTAYNVTIPISCLNYDNNKIIFRIYSDSGAGDLDSNSFGQCYNGDWVNITENSESTGSFSVVDGCDTYWNDGNYSTHEIFIAGDFGWCGNGERSWGGRIFEEAIYWEVDDSPIITWINPTSTTQGNLIYTSININISLSDDDNLLNYTYTVTGDTGVVSNSSNTSMNTTSYEIYDALTLTNSGVYNITVIVCDQDDECSSETVSFYALNITWETPNPEGYIYFDTLNYNLTIAPNVNLSTYNITLNYSINVSNNGSTIFTDTGTGITGLNNGAITGSETLSSSREYNFSITVCDLVDNCYTEMYNFYEPNITITYNESVYSGFTNDFNIYITCDTGYMIDNAQVTLNYYGSTYVDDGFKIGCAKSFDMSFTAPNTTGLGENVSFYFTFISYGENTVPYTTSSQIQEVIRYGTFDDCSLYNYTAINYTFKDELTDALINVSIDYEFENLAYSYNQNETGSSDYDFCMDPDGSNFPINITLQYSATGYTTRTYIQNDYSIDSTQDNITLYLLNSSSATEITLHTTDDSDNNLEDITIEVYRYDIAADDDLLIQTENTDYNGNAVFDLETGDTFYSFKFYEGSDLKLATTRFKLFATSYEYVISDYSQSILAEWLILNNGITRSLTYSDTTNIVNFSWSYAGSLIDYFCLEVMTYNQTYYYNCSSSSASSINYTISQLNISYIAIGTVNTTSGNTYTISQIGIEAREGWEEFGTDYSILLVMLVFLSISLLSLINAKIAIVGSTMALIFMFFMGILPLSIAGLIGIVCLAIVILIVITRAGT